MMTIPSIDNMMTSSGDPVANAESSRAAQSAAFDPVVSNRMPLGEQPPFGGLAELVSDSAALGEALKSLVDALDLPSGTEKPAVTAEAQVAPEAVAVYDSIADGEEKPAEDKAVVLQAAPVVSAQAGDSVVPVREVAVDAVAAVSAVGSVDVSAMFLAAAEEVAAAVTVSPALMRGEAGEIRVQLRPDVLEGAEVVVAVDGKKMDVTFVPAVTHVADTVAANQSLVQQQLAARISGFEISVAVAQTVATNVAVNVGSERAAHLAVNRARRTNGRA